MRFISSRLLLFVLLALLFTLTFQAKDFEDGSFKSYNRKYGKRYSSN